MKKTFRTCRAFLCALLLAPLLALAADPTPAQLQTLKSACAADITCNDLMTQADDVGMAAWFNTVDATFIVWRPDVRALEMDSAMTWTEVDGLTVGKARIWEWMRTTAPLDCRAANIRQGLSDAFASATATKAALQAVCKRVATRAEKALATGTGTSGSPATMSWYGTLTYQQASLVRTA